MLTGSDSAAESARTAFAKGWEGVPLRFMLPWAAQMLTLLDADGGEVLLPVLMVSCATAVALHILPAPLFPFKISRPDNVSRHILPKTVAVLAAHGRHIFTTWSGSLLHPTGSSRYLVSLQPYTQKVCMIGKYSTHVSAV